MDLDWVFDDDNTKQLVRLLAKKADPTLLKQKTFKVFIDVLWGYYQPYIKYYVFIPFLIYSAIFIYFATFLFGIHFEGANLFDETKESIDVELSNQHVVMIVEILGWPAWFLLFYIIMIEVIAIRRDGIESYIRNTWNLLDLTSIVCNIAFFFHMYIDVNNGNFQ